MRVGTFAGEADEWDTVAASALAAGRREFESVFPALAEVALPIGGVVNQALETIITDDAAQQFREHLTRSDFEMTDAKQLDTLRAALEIAPSERLTAREVMRQSAAAADRLFEGVDAVLVASRTDTARPLDGPRPPRRESASDIMRALGNLAGLPGVSFPCGLAKDGLPVGLQLVGPRGSDARLLAAVQAYQEQTGHHLLRPPGLLVAGTTFDAPEHLL